MRSKFIILIIVFIKCVSINCQPTPISLPSCPAAVLDNGTRLICEYYYPELNWSPPIPPSDNRVIVYWGNGDWRNYNGELFSFVNFNGGRAIIDPNTSTDPYIRPEGGILLILNGNICKYKYDGSDGVNDHVFLLDEDIEFSLFQGVSTECTDDNSLCLFDFLVTETKDYFYNRKDCKVWSGKCQGSGLISLSQKYGNLMIGSIPPIPTNYSTVTKGIIADYVRVLPSINLTPCDPVRLKYEFIDYDLDKIQSFIEKNGHLPGTPSGKLIEAEGEIDLHAVNLDQQHKIELLYKHVSDIENQIEAVRRSREK